MGFLSGATLGLVAVVLLHVIQMSLASKRMERKIDSLMKQAGLDLAQFDAQEAQNRQQFAPQRQLLVRLVLLGLVVGAAVTGLVFVLRPWLAS